MIVKDENILGWVQECLSLCQATLDAPIVVEWNGRFTRCLGRAFYDGSRYVIELRKRKWKELGEAAQRHIVFHEVCHSIIRQRYGPAMGHSPEWKALMRMCGYPNAGARMAIPKEAYIRRVGENVEVRCGCTDLLVSRQRAKKMLRGVKYICLTCKSDLAIVDSHFLDEVKR